MSPILVGLYLPDDLAADAIVFGDDAGSASVIADEKCVSLGEFG
jgi:hypothetical protein